MTYIDYLKQYDNYDRFILFLLAIGCNITDTAKLAEVTRDTVYTVIKRNQDLITNYAVAIGDVMETLRTTENEGTPDHPDLTDPNEPDL